MYNTVTLINKNSAAKAGLMMERERNEALLQPVSNAAFDVTVPYSERKPYHDVLKAFLHMAHANVMRKAADITVSLRRHLQQLKEAELANKREVLRSIPIVTAPVAAASLGLQVDALLTNENYCRAVFGALYIGALCYSMDDLYLITQNPDWILPHSFQAPSKHRHSSPIVPDHLIFVDWEVATAYTDLSLGKLAEQVQKSTHPKRHYRLSDLEKIRVAKLNAQQH